MCWSIFYGAVDEHIPPNSPEVIGKAIDLHMFMGIYDREMNFGHRICSHDRCSEQTRQTV
ncbi:hypothetical protein ACHAXS_000780 [Conticribra weissflogii]